MSMARPDNPEKNPDDTIRIKIAEPYGTSGERLSKGQYERVAYGTLTISEKTADMLRKIDPDSPFAGRDLAQHGGGICMEDTSANSSGFRSHLLIGLSCACRARVEMLVFESNSPAMWRYPNGSMDVAELPYTCECGRQYRSVDGDAPGIELVT